MARRGRFGARHIVFARDPISRRVFSPKDNWHRGSQIRSSLRGTEGSNPSLQRRVKRTPYPGARRAPLPARLYMMRSAYDRMDPEFTRQSAIARSPLIAASANVCVDGLESRLRSLGGAPNRPKGLLQRNDAHMARVGTASPSPESSNPLSSSGESSHRGAGSAAVRGRSRSTRPERASFHSSTRRVSAWRLWSDS